MRARVCGGAKVRDQMADFAKFGSFSARPLPFSFLYKHTSIDVIDFFVYLGVYFHWQHGGSAAYEYREDKGVKAFGVLCSQLQLVPFLPFSRTVELGESIVGGAYLYGAEFWAPFIPIIGEGSQVNSKYFNVETETKRVSFLQISER